MAKFAFKLETVLQQRRNSEDERQRELAKLLRERMILLDQLRSIQSTITHSKSELRQSLTGSVDLMQVSQFARFSAQATGRAHAIVNRLAGVEQSVEAARARLIESTKARKAIERLREKQYRKWTDTQQRREAAELDEIGVGRHAMSLLAGDER